MDTKIGFGRVNAIELIKSFLVDEGRWMMVCDRTSCSKHCRVRRERQSARRDRTFHSDAP
ncbi:MAG: hypothetical protein WBA89_27185 [Microcoleus sp.]|uniref:hypothetical protein n=1 Tax=Microcoleus sp. TaxID=44472 RepID=UPI003C751B6B